VRVRLPYKVGFAPDELLDAIRARIADPALRIDLKTIPAPPLYPPATKESLEAAEAELGFRLPHLLRRLYSEVENGGFGPGAGLVGVRGGHPDIDGRPLGALYNALRSEWWPREGLLPLWDWGCAAWSCVDSRAADERVFAMDDTGPTPTQFTLLSWLEAWTKGVNLFDVR